MRLLQLDDSDSLSLVEYVHDIPPFAILSHTWGADGEEVTFKDLMDGGGKGKANDSKAGYDKIRFCGRQAAKDGLRLFWVDTCCIDKSSSAELTEAINSMFRWYQNAEKCYVYLADLSSQEPWKPLFQRSKWFTRGWTVQELLAPASVEFFSVEGDRLGDKRSLMHEIHYATGISIHALQGSPLSHFTINQRMQWVEGRQTKREEDMVYSLLGIFNVSMPLVYGEGREKALVRLQREIGWSLSDMSSTLPAPSTEVAKQDRKPFSTVPFGRDPDFVERPAVSAWIREKCSPSGTRAAIVGLGGVGKSQLAIRYTHDIRQEHPQMWVFWVHASTAARFEEAYKNIADRLELPGRDMPNVDTLRLVRDWLCDDANGPWTMVIDNADDVTVFFPEANPKPSSTAEQTVGASRPLAPYIPKTHGSILITSRSKDAAYRLTGSYKNIRELHAMDTHQALQLLRNKLADPSVEDTMVALVHALDHIPLVIDQAAAYINRGAPRMTVSRYLDDFRKSEKKKTNLLNKDAGDLRRDESASNSVATMWQMSFEQIQRERDSAAQLLSLMSFFNPQGIPVWVLRTYLRLRKGSQSAGHYENIAIHTEDEENEEYEDIDDEFNDDLDTLRAYSLVRITLDGDFCEMHPLVQFCTKIFLASLDQIKHWRRVFLFLMAAVFPNGEFEDWSTCQVLLPHIEPMLDHEPADENLLGPWCKLMHPVVWYKRGQGSYAEAEIMVRKALRTNTRIEGYESSSTLEFVGLLALLLERRGQYEEAEKMLRRALEAYEEMLEKDHLCTLVCMSNLALMLYFQRKYEEAEKMHRRVLEEREKVLGDKHLSTLHSMHNLAMVLQDQGKYEEVEKMHRQVLEGREKALGDEHPDTLVSVTYLASVLREQWQYQEAEKMYRRALVGYEKMLGKEHPETLSSLNDVACMLLDRGKCQEAEKMYRRVLEGREKVLGDEHFYTLKSVNNLALCLHREGRYKDALPLYERGVSGSKRVLGPSHAETIMYEGLLQILTDMPGLQGM